MVLSFYFLWDVPDVFKGSNTSLFWYLVIVNLFLRTAFTVFVIPYVALGFKMCSDYNGRTKLQGIRWGLNMLANLCGPALAWAIFFRGEGATTIQANYIRMSAVFSIAALFFVFCILIASRKYMADSRNIKLMGNSIKSFIIDMREISQISIRDGHLLILLLLCSGLV